LHRLAKFDPNRRRLEFYNKCDFGRTAAETLLRVCTKFEENIFIADRDKVEKPRPRWRPPPSWILTELRFWAQMTIVCLLRAKFDAITFIGDRDNGQKDAARHYLKFFQKCNFQPPGTLVWQCPCTYQIGYNYLHWRPSYRREKSQMTAAVILNFTNGVILDIRDGRKSNINLHTKFDAICSSKTEIMAENPNPRWRPPPSWISKECHFSMSSIYLQTKFGANRQRSGRGTTLCGFPRWQPP